MHDASRPDRRIRSALGQARRNIEQKQWDLAEANLAYASALAPVDPVPRFLRGQLDIARDRPEAALAAFLEALELDQANGEYLVSAAEAAQRSGQVDAALALLDWADACDATPALRLRHAIVLDLCGEQARALPLAERLRVEMPASPKARLLHARCLSVLGRIDEGAAAYRGMIEAGISVPSAWFGLVDLKTPPVSESDLTAIRARLRDRALGEHERIMLLHALGAASERLGAYDHAFESFRAANELKRVRSRWNATRFARRLRELEAAHETWNLPASAPEGDPDDGQGVIFIVGLPRSGTTLFEQILGAHPRVEGCGELPDLPRVLEDEAARFARPIEDWAHTATDADWRRLGAIYLERTKRWRSSKPRHTDKLPSNWTYAGYIHRMLPQARVLHIDRDPVEATWSCYKQLFAPGMVDYACEFGALADVWGAQKHFGAFWQQRAPMRYRVCSYEALVANPELAIAEILAFCGLPPDARCHEFHLNPRAVRTPSAAQVRRPLEARRRLSDAYGELLEPLRAAIAGAAARWSVPISPRTDACRPASGSC